MGGSNRLKGTESRLGATDSADKSGAWDLEAQSPGVSPERQVRLTVPE